MKKIREGLVRLRGKRSQAEMATIYGTSQQNWFNWENGISRPRDYALMSRISNDADISLEELFFDLFDRKKLSKIKSA